MYQRLKSSDRKSLPFLLQIARILPILRWLYDASKSLSFGCITLIPSYLLQDIFYVLPQLFPTTDLSIKN